MTPVLADAYAALPTLNCQRRCQDVCGPVGATGIERMNLLTTHGRAIGPDHTGRRCRLLDARGDCSVYADRPMICRIVGLTRETACRFGCVPSRWLTEDEAYQALRPLMGRRR